MSAILYPVAASAEAALAKPQGRAAREREAAALAGAPVRFVTEATGPAFATREAALDAFAGRLDDAAPRARRAGRARGPLLRARRADRGLRRRRRSSRPSRAAAAGRSRRPGAARTVFRLMVSYWRTSAAAAEPAPTPTRPGRSGAGPRPPQLNAAELRALAQQPLRPVKPQQPLDVGLFEAPAPEAPHILIPDE